MGETSKKRNINNDVVYRFDPKDKSIINFFRKYYTIAGSSEETQYLFELANLYYLTVYGTMLNVAPTSLLSFADIWGTPIFFAGGIP